MNDKYEKEVYQIIDQINQYHVELKGIERKLKRYGFKNSDQANDLLNENYLRKDAGITAFVYMGLFAGSMLFPATAILQVLQVGLLLGSTVQVFRLVSQNKQRKLILENKDSIIETIKLQIETYEKLEKANLRLESAYSKLLASDGFTFSQNDAKTKENNNKTNIHQNNQNNHNQNNQNSKKDDDRTL